MRIVHTCLRYPPATGGVETYIQSIVEHTRNIEADRDVRVLTSKLRTHGPVTELDPELLLDDPPFVQRLHHAQTPFFSYPRLQALQYYIGHHKPEILHGHSFWYHPADAAARYAKKHQVPFIFHPYYYEHGVRHKASWQLYKRTIGRATFAAADVVTVISPFEQKTIEDAGFPVKRFELIPPSVDQDEFATLRENPFRVRGITGPILLAVSRIAPGKGLNELVNAMPHILKGRDNAQLVIIGEDFGAEEELQQQIARLGLEHHIHLFGKVSRTELVAAYQHADLFVHPSHFEAFGIVLAESLTAGTPVIARKTAAIPYVAPHNTAGLLFTTKQELTKSILDLLNDTQRRYALAESGKKHIIENFSVISSTKKIADLYKTLRTS